MGLRLVPNLICLSLLLNSASLHAVQGVVDLGVDVAHRISPELDLLFVHSSKPDSIVRAYKLSTLENFRDFNIPDGQILIDLEVDVAQRSLVALTTQNRLIRWPLSSSNSMPVSLSLEPTNARKPLGAISSKCRRVIANSDQGVSIWDADSRELLGKIMSGNGGAAVEIICSVDSDVALVIMSDATVWYDVAQAKEISRSSGLELHSSMEGKKSQTGRYFALRGKGKIYLFDLLHQQMDYVDCKSEVENSNGYAFAGNDKYLLVKHSQENESTIDAWKLGDSLSDLSYSSPIDGCIGGAIIGLRHQSAVVMHGSLEQDKRVTGVEIRSLLNKSKRQPFGSYVLRDSNWDPRTLSAITASDDEKLLAAATTNGDLHLWNVESPLRRLVTDNARLSRVDALSTGSLRGSATLPASTISIEFTPGNHGLIVKSGDRHSYLLPIEKLFPTTETISFDYGAMLSDQFYPSTSEIRRISFSPNGQQLLCATVDTVSILDVTAETETRRLVRSVVGASFSSNGTQAFLIGPSGTGFLNIQSGSFSSIANFGEPSGKITGTLISGLNINDKLAVVDAERGALVSLISPKSVLRGGLHDISDDQTLLATAGRLGSGSKLGVEIIDIVSADSLATIGVESNGMYGVFFLPDKSKIAVVGADSTKIYDFRRNRLVSEFPAKKQEAITGKSEVPTPITGFAFNSWASEVGSDALPVQRAGNAAAHDSVSGRVAISFRQKVNVWDIAKGSLVWTGILEGDDITHLALARGGKKLAAGMKNGKIRIVTFDPAP